MPDNVAVREVERRLAEGWRPSREQERTWVRGLVTTRKGPDGDPVEVAATESEPMTEAEEQALIEHRYSPGYDDAEYVMVDDLSGQAGDDG